MSARPNILLIITDQQSANAIGCSGNTDLKTPNMDDLASDGVRFTRAYCATPSCAPARNSIMTGRVPQEIEFSDGVIAHPEATLGRVLSDGGYDCLYAGNRSFAMSEDPEICGFDALSRSRDREMAGECSEFLKRRATEDGAAPFFLVASFINPHNICQWAREQPTYLGEIEERHIHDCPSLPANHEIAPYEPQAIRTFAATHPSAFSTDYQTDDPNWWRRYRSAYYRLIELVDEHIGILLEGLRESGLYDDTLIVFTADHGDGQGAHKLKQKLFLYEEQSNVPFIVKPPASTEIDSPVSDQLVHTGLDIMPTLCDFANVPIGVQAAESASAGRSLRSLVERSEEAPDWRQRLVIEIDRTPSHLPGMQFAKHGGKNLIARAVFEERFKYVIYDWGRYREQLFDLETDPGEMVNLASSSRFASKLGDMRAYLRAWCEQRNDQMLKMIPVGSGPAPY